MGQAPADTQSSVTVSSTLSVGETFMSIEWSPLDWAAPSAFHPQSQIASDLVRNLTRSPTRTEIASNSRAGAKSLAYGRKFKSQWASPAASCKFLAKRLIKQEVQEALH